MDEVTQLISFLVSFFFGFLFYFFTKFHFYMIQKLMILFQYLWTFLFILDAVLLYIFILYYINQGVVHVYFLSFVFLGFLGAYFLRKNVKFTLFKNKFIGKKYGK